MVYQLILLLISNRDASMYLDIVERFMYLIDSSSNIKKIQIISSNEYSDLDKEDIVKSIRQKFNIDNSSFNRIRAFILPVIFSHNLIPKCRKQKIL